jgi:hypothetical protein
MALTPLSHPNSKIGEFEVICKNAMGCETEARGDVFFFFKTRDEKPRETVPFPYSTVLTPSHNLSRKKHFFKTTDHILPKKKGNQ